LNKQFRYAFRDCSFFRYLIYEYFISNRNMFLIYKNNKKIDALNHKRLQTYLWHYILGASQITTLFVIYQCIFFLFNVLEQENQYSFYFYNIMSCDFLSWQTEALQIYIFIYTVWKLYIHNMTLKDLTSDRNNFLPT